MLTLEKKIYGLLLIALCSLLGNKNLNSYIYTFYNNTGGPLMVQAAITLPFSPWRTINQPDSTGTLQPLQPGKSITSDDSSGYCLYAVQAYVPGEQPTSWYVANSVGGTSFFGGGTSCESFSAPYGIQINATANGTLSIEAVASYSPPTVTLDTINNTGGISFKVYNINAPLYGQTTTDTSTPGTIYAAIMSPPATTQSCGTNALQSTIYQAIKNEQTGQIGGNSLTNTGIVIRKNSELSGMNLILGGLGINPSTIMLVPSVPSCQPVIFIGQDSTGSGNYYAAAFQVNNCAPTGLSGSTMCCQQASGAACPTDMPYTMPVNNGASIVAGLPSSLTDCTTSGCNSSASQNPSAPVDDIVTQQDVTEATKLVLTLAKQPQSNCPTPSTTCGYVYVQSLTTL